MRSYWFVYLKLKLIPSWFRKIFLAATGTRQFW